MPPRKEQPLPQNQRPQGPPQPLDSLEGNPDVNMQAQDQQGVAPRIEGTFTSMFKALLKKNDMTPFSIVKNEFGSQDPSWYRVIQLDGFNAKEPTRSTLSIEVQFVNDVAETKNGQPARNETARKNIIKRVHGKTDLLKGREGVELTGETSKAMKNFDKNAAEQKREFEEQQKTLEGPSELEEHHIEKSSTFYVLEWIEGGNAFYLPKDCLREAVPYQIDENDGALNLVNNLDQAYYKAQQQDKANQWKEGHATTLSHEQILRQEELIKSSNQFAQVLSDMNDAGTGRRIKRFCMYMGIPAFTRRSPMLDEFKQPILPFISTPLGLVARVAPVVCGKLYPQLLNGVSVYGQPEWAVSKIIFQCVTRSYTRQFVEKYSKNMNQLFNDTPEGPDKNWFAKMTMYILQWGMKAAHLCERHYPVSSVYGQLQPVRFRKSRGYISLSQAQTHIMPEHFYRSLQDRLNRAETSEDAKHKRLQLIQECKERNTWRQPGTKIVGGLRLCDSAEEGTISNLPLTNALNRSMGVTSLSSSAEGGIRFPGALVPMILSKPNNVFLQNKDKLPALMDSLSSLNNGNPLELSHLSGIDLAQVGKYSNHEEEQQKRRGALSALQKDRKKAHGAFMEVLRDQTRFVDSPEGTVRLELIDVLNFDFYEDWPNRGANTDGRRRMDNVLTEWLQKIGTALQETEMNNPDTTGQGYRLRLSDLLMEIKYVDAKALRGARNELKDAKPDDVLDVEQFGVFNTLHTVRGNFHKAHGLQVFPQYQSAQMIRLAPRQGPHNTPNEPIHHFENFKVKPQGHKKYIVDIPSWNQADILTERVWGAFNSTEDQFYKNFQDAPYFRMKGDICQLEAIHKILSKMMPGKSATQLKQHDFPRQIQLWAPVFYKTARKDELQEIVRHGAQHSLWNSEEMRHIDWNHASTMEGFNILTELSAKVARMPEKEFTGFCPVPAKQIDSKPNATAFISKLSDDKKRFVNNGSKPDEEIVRQIQEEGDLVDAGEGRTDMENELDGREKRWATVLEQTLRNFADHVEKEKQINDIKGSHQDQLNPALYLLSAAANKDQSEDDVQHNFRLIVQNWASKQNVSKMQKNSDLLIAVMLHYQVTQSIPIGVLMSQGNSWMCTGQTPKLKEQADVEYRVKSLLAFEFLDKVSPQLVQNVHHICLGSVEFKSAFNRLTEAAAVLMRLLDGCAPKTYHSFFYDSPGPKYNVGLMLGLQLVDVDQLKSRWQVDDNGYLIVDQVDGTFKQTVLDMYKLGTGQMPRHLDTHRSNVVQSIQVIEPLDVAELNDDTTLFTILHELRRHVLIGKDNDKSWYQRITTVADGIEPVYLVQLRGTNFSQKNGRLQTPEAALRALPPAEKKKCSTTSALWKPQQDDSKPHLKPNQVEEETKDQALGTGVRLASLLRQQLSFEDERHADRQPTPNRVLNQFLDNRKKAVRWCKQQFSFTEVAQTQMTGEVVNYDGPVVADIVLAQETIIHEKTGVLQDGEISGISIVNLSDAEKRLYEEAAKKKKSRQANPNAPMKIQGVTPSPKQLGPQVISQYDANMVQLDADEPDSVCDVNLKKRGQNYDLKSGNPVQSGSAVIVEMSGKRSESVFVKRAQSFQSQILGIQMALSNNKKPLETPSTKPTTYGNQMDDVEFQRQKKPVKKRQARPQSPDQDGEDQSSLSEEAVDLPDAGYLQQIVDNMRGFERPRGRTRVDIPISLSLMRKNAASTRAATFQNESLSQTGSQLGDFTNLTQEQIDYLSDTDALTSPVSTVASKQVVVIKHDPSRSNKINLPDYSQARANCGDHFSTCFPPEGTDLNILMRSPSRYDANFNLGMTEAQKVEIYKSIAPRIFYHLVNHLPLTGTVVRGRNSISNYVIGQEMYEKALYYGIYDFSETHRFDFFHRIMCAVHCDNATLEGFHRLMIQTEDHQRFRMRPDQQGSSNHANRDLSETHLNYLVRSLRIDGLGSSIFAMDRLMTHRDQRFPLSMGYGGHDATTRSWQQGRPFTSQRDYNTVFANDPRVPDPSQEKLLDPVVVPMLGFEMSVTKAEQPLPNQNPLLINRGFQNAPIEIDMDDQTSDKQTVKKESSNQSVLKPLSSIKISKTAPTKSEAIPQKTETQAVRTETIDLCSQPQAAAEEEGEQEQEDEDAQMLFCVKNDEKQKEEDVSDIAPVAEDQLANQAPLESEPMQQDSPEDAVPQSPVEQAPSIEQPQQQEPEDDDMSGAAENDQPPQVNDPVSQAQEPTENTGSKTDTLEKASE